MSLRDFSSDELLIGKIKAVTPDTEIKTLFDAYDYEKSFEQNVNLLGTSRTILQKHLVSAVKVLQSMGDEYPGLKDRLSAIKTTGNSFTKVTAATAIVSFIHDAREIKCLKCKKDFSPYSSDNAHEEIKCFKCKRPSHRECYADTQVDEEIGLVFLCSLCFSIKSHPPTEQPEKKPPGDVPAVSKPSSEDKPPEQEAEKNAEPASSHEETGDDSKPPEVEKKRTSKDENYDRSRSVCPLLLNQQCPHGITGRSGGVCENYHPVWCRKYMRNGPEGKYGCKRGDKCRFYHTQLCQNGVVSQMCLNPDCKLIHIRGVRRIKGANNASSKPAAPGKGKKTPNQATDNPPPQSRNRKKSESAKVSDNTDFLKHLDQIKANWTAEVTKGLSAMIQTTFQSMMAPRQPQQMYLPPGVQYQHMVHQQQQQQQQPRVFQPAHHLQGYPILQSAAPQTVPTM